MKARAPANLGVQNIPPTTASTSQKDNSVEQPNASINAKTASAHVKLTKQKQIIASIKRIIQSVLTNTEDKSHQFYELNLKTIQQHWSHAQLLHDQLWAITEDTCEYDFEKYTVDETEINNGMLAIIKLMESTSIVSEPRQAAIQVPSSAKLPQIELPKFDGNYLQWRQFHDLFLELVHNSALPTCQKMMYLKSSLTGEARPLISHFTTAAVNYNAAWNVLIDRYENKRILVNALLHKLLQQPYTNIETASSLKLLHDITYECLLSLRGLNILIDHWDPLLLHLLVQRLSKIPLTRYRNNP